MEITPFVTTCQIVSPPAPTKPFWKSLSHHAMIKMVGGSVVSQRSLTPRELRRFLERQEQWVDHAHSINTFRYGSRRTKDLVLFQACWSDCDTYKVGLSPEEAWPLILKRLADVGAPPPTHILLSGRGLWVLWTIHAVDASYKAEWHLAQSAIQLALTDFGADPQAMDASRCMRLPGSINSKSGKRVEIFANPDLTKRAVPLDAFKNIVTYGVPVGRQRNLLPDPVLLDFKPESFVRSFEYVTSVLGSIKTACLGQFSEHLLKVFRNTIYRVCLSARAHLDSGSKDGFREIICHLLGNCFANLGVKQVQLHPYMDLFLSNILELGPGHPERKEFHAAAVSAYRHWNTSGRFISAGYTYSTFSLYQKCGISSGERKIIEESLVQLGWLARPRSWIFGENVRTEAEKNIRIAEAHLLVEGGTTSSRIAEVTGKSLRSAQRYLLTAALRLEGVVKRPQTKVSSDCATLTNHKIKKLSSALVSHARVSTTGKVESGREADLRLARAALAKLVVPVPAFEIDLVKMRMKTVEQALKRLDKDLLYARRTYKPKLSVPAVVMVKNFEKHRAVWLEMSKFAGKETAQPKVERANAPAIGPLQRVEMRKVESLREEKKVWVGTSH